MPSNFYCNAFRADGSLVLGNLDGQFAFGNVRNYKRTIFYKRLVAGEIRVSPSINNWTITDSTGKIHETIYRKLTEARRLEKEKNQ